MARTQSKSKANANSKAKVQPVINKVYAPVANSAKDIWYAGLGVFSVARQESEKLVGQGNRLFDKLVTEGSKLETKSLDKAEHTVEEIRSDVESRFSGVRKQAKESWVNLENVFDERVSGTLERLGIPGNRDLSELSGKVQKLSRDASSKISKFEKSVEKKVSQMNDNIRDVTVAEIKKMEAGFEDLSKQFSQNWSKLENLIDARVADLAKTLELADMEVVSKLSAELKSVSDQLAKLEKELVELRKSEAKSATTTTATAK